MNLSKKHVNVGAAFLVLAVGLSNLPAREQEIKLVIHPAEVTSEAGKYALLPKPESLRDGDAVPLYKKAIAALPADDADLHEITQWLSTPLDQLPVETVEGVLQQHMESLRLAAMAVRSRECKWSTNWRSFMDDASEYRRLAYIISLWVRFELVQGRYDGAALAMQTGFGVAHHLCQAPTVIQALVGQAVAGIMCRDVEQWIQWKDAPNLHKAISDLPSPFMDAEQVIARESQTLEERLMNKFASKATQNMANQTRDRFRAKAKGMESRFGALACVEAIRAHAASHAGQLPQTLDDIKELSLAVDPLSEQPFKYTRTSAGAVLESAVPDGGDKKDQIRYEIVMKN